MIKRPVFKIYVSARGGVVAQNKIYAQVQSTNVVL